MDFANITPTKSKDKLFCGIFLQFLRQFCKICCRETLQLLQRKLAKGNEILNLNPYPIFYKSVLRKVLAQIFNLFAVSSIYWRYCH